MQPALALALVTALGACRARDATGPDAATSIVGPSDVAWAQRKTITTGPRLLGTLEPRQRAVIRAEVAGDLTEVNVDVGQRVAAGRVLARIDADALGDAYRSAQAAVRSAASEAQVVQRQLARTSTLASKGFVAVQDLDVARANAQAARARLQEARARLAQAREQLEHATVEAPISGLVSERAVSQGDVVTVGAPLFTIVDPSTMRLEASVPAQELGALRVGTPVRFDVRGYPGEAFTGQIEHIAPAVNPQTRQVELLVAIPNPTGRLIAGLFADGRLETRRREALVIPIDAVDQMGETSKVTRVRQGRVERVTVKLGLRDERAQEVEVVEGLAPGDPVLVGAARELASGTPVELPARPGAAARE